MGLFDRFKKTKSIKFEEIKTEEINKIDDCSYTKEIKGIIFVSEEEPSEEQLQLIADNYWNKIYNIIEFMMPDLEEVYDDIDIEIVKAKLGRPTIDYENGRVDYCEQTFDDIHIFSFEFLDDSFEDLQYFSIDG